MRSPRKFHVTSIAERLDRVSIFVGQNIILNEVVLSNIVLFLHNRVRRKSRPCVLTHRYPNLKKLKS